MNMVVTLPRRVFLYCQPVDLRQGQLGLIGIVRQDTNKEMANDAVYIFSNRSRSLVKGVFWDRTGYIVFSKRLEAGRFQVPLAKEMASLDQKSLRLFLDGLKLFL